ncbi:DUF1801 domain-containing protein [Aquabacterium sp. J223]|uniref:DUF1801 domain-containing protein n=1 Tax=Aquabacterium sp. J223 TaxID=2898431 RepID=UPI0021AD55CC|nr:DUF1801 domain-containing protein [Aquabacterium sp. J223]UUX95424.1 DUF1801 domain-containing protein [Aquabacterium sp. J223]
MRTLIRPGALVESWFDLLQEEPREIARSLHRAVQRSGLPLQPTVRWGNLVFTHNGLNTVALVPHRHHVDLQVFAGAELAAAFPELEGGSKGTRSLRCRHPVDEHDPLLPQLLQAAVAALPAVAGRRAEGAAG